MFTFLMQKNLMGRVNIAAGQLYEHILILNLNREIRL